MAALSGLETIKEVRKRQNKTLLAFSGGKEGAGTNFANKKFFFWGGPHYFYFLPFFAFFFVELGIF